MNTRMVEIRNKLAAIGLFLFICFEFASKHITTILLVTTTFTLTAYHGMTEALQEKIIIDNSKVSRSNLGRPIVITKDSFIYTRDSIRIPYAEYVYSKAESLFVNGTDSILMKVDKNIFSLMYRLEDSIKYTALRLDTHNLIMNVTIANDNRNVRLRNDVLQIRWQKPTAGKINVKEQQQQLK